MKMIWFFTLSLCFVLLINTGIAESDHFTLSGHGEELAESNVVNDARVNVDIDKNKEDFFGDLGLLFPSDADDTDVTVDNQVDVAMNIEQREHPLADLFSSGINDLSSQQANANVRNQGNVDVKVEDDSDSFDDLFGHNLNTLFEQDKTEIDVDNKARVGIDIQQEQDLFGSTLAGLFDTRPDTEVDVDNAANVAVNVEKRSGFLDDLFNQELFDTSKVDVDVANQADVLVEVQETDSGLTGFAQREVLRDLLAQRGIGNDVLDSLFGSRVHEPERIITVDNKADVAVDVQKKGDNGDTAVTVDNKGTVVVNIQERERRRIEDVLDRDFQLLNAFIRNNLGDGGNLAEVFADDRKKVDLHNLLERVWGEDLDDIFEHEDEAALQNILQILFREKQFALTDILSDRLEDIFGRDQEIINIFNNMDVEVQVVDEDPLATHQGIVDRELSNNLEETIENQQLIQGAE